MTREQLSKRIDSTIRDANRLEEAVRTLDVTDMERFPAEYQSFSENAAAQAEWLTCRLRHLIYETTAMRKQEYLLRAADAQGIRFHNHDGIFEIILPGISPAPDGRRPSEFLTAPLHAALDDYFRSHAIPRYRRCVLCYTLVFDRALPGRVFSGVNSPELKRLQDVAASYLLVDDSPKYIDVFHSTELGEHDAVRMGFMEHGRFSRWLHEREQNCEQIGA